jgi:hypothetical protein
MGCSGLLVLEIPESVQVIGKFAFSHCSSLISITIPARISTLKIHAAAFSNCKSLISLVIPNHDNVMFVMPPEGYDARNPPPFGQCSTLERIHRTSILQNLNEWLQGRYDNFPLHQLCYEPNITDHQLEKFLKCNNNNNNDDVLEQLDSLNMTSLHVLACNPNVTPSMITTMVDRYPNALLDIEAANRMTPIKLYLCCQGHKNICDDILDTNDGTGGGGAKSLQKAMEKGLNFHDIDIVLAFQSSMAEKGIQDGESGLYPFMKAAVLPQTSLDVIYNLALYDLSMF